MARKNKGKIEFPTDTPKQFELGDHLLTSRGGVWSGSTGSRWRGRKLRCYRGSGRTQERRQQTEETEEETNRPQNKKTQQSED